MIDGFRLKRVPKTALVLPGFAELAFSPSDHGRGGPIKADKTHRFARLCQCSWLWLSAVVVLALLMGPVSAWGAATNSGPTQGRLSSSHREHKCKKKHGKHGKQRKCKKRRHHKPRVKRPNTSAPPPESPPHPEFEPAPKLDQVPGADVKQLPSEGDPKLIVGGEHSYTPGQFLTAAPETGAPKGFLLKVVSSTAAGGETEVQTEPGSLYEAVPNGEINADLGNLGSAIPMNADARAFSRAEKRPAPGAKHRLSTEATCRSARRCRPRLGGNEIDRAYQCGIWATLRT